MRRVELNILVILQILSLKLFLGRTFFLHNILNINSNDINNNYTNTNDDDDDDDGDDDVRTF